MRKAVAIYGLVFVLVWLSIFVYDHPHLPVVLDDAQTCQAYQLDVPARTMTLSRPFYGGLWVVGKPVTCSNQVMHEVVTLLRNPFIYGRPTPRYKSHFDARFAYRLHGTSGSVIILFDIYQHWFLVDKFDRSGKLISTTGECQETGRWLGLLCKTFPHNQMIASAWKEEASQ